MTEAALFQDVSVPQTEISSAIAFTIERSLLLKALARVQSVVERRNTIAVLSNVKLETANNTLSLTATDMDIAVTETIPANVTTQGALTVPAHTLYDIVRKLPEGAQISVAGDASNTGKVSIEAGSCHFQLSSLPVTDFPVLDKGEMSSSFTLAATELGQLIEKTRFAISTEETRYYLNGIYFHTKETDAGRVIAAVATDGHRLAKLELTAPDGAENIPGVIIPRKTVLELKKLVDETEGEVQVSLSETKIAFAAGEATLLSKLIDGTFPDYDKVIPSNNTKTLTVDTAALSKAIDRVATIASEKTRAIKFTVEKGKLTLSANNEESGAASEELDVDYNASSIEVGFNSRYLLEMLSGFEGAQAQFLFADASAPSLVKDVANAGALYVIMPMRI